MRNTNPDLEFVQRGSSLKICMVASGEADIYPRFATVEWGTAAGHTIALAAGKRMAKTDWKDNLTYKQRKSTKLIIYCHYER